MSHVAELWSRARGQVCGCLHTSINKVDLFYLDSNRLMVLETAEPVLRLQGIALRVFRRIESSGWQVLPGQSIKPAVTESPPLSNIYKQGPSGYGTGQLRAMKKNTA